MTTTPSMRTRPAESEPVPRWLHVLALVPIALLLALAGILVLGYVTAGPEANLAGVLVIWAGIITIPAVVAGLLWVLGTGLARRSTTAARVLIVVSIAISGLTVLSQAMLWLAGL